MARLMTIGFENNDSAKEGMTPVVGSTVQSAIVRSGTYALKIGSLTSATRQYSSLTEGTSNSTQIYIRFYLYIVTRPTADNMIFSIANTSPSFGGKDANVRLTTTGGLKLNTSDTQQGSTSGTLSLNTWYRIEVRYKPGATSSGILELWIDGVKAAENQTVTLANHQYISFAGNFNAEAQTTGEWYFDDIAINDTTGSFQNSFPGSGKVIYLRPNAAGDNNALLKADGTTAGDTNNYTLVNEVTPDDATTYVRTKTTIASGNPIDDYRLQASGIGASDTVNVVAVGMRYKSSNNDSNLRIKSVSGGTVTSGSQLANSAGSFATNRPNATGGPTPQLTTYATPEGQVWSKTTLDTMQIGLFDDSSGGFEVDLSTIWAYVDYTPLSNATTLNNYQFVKVGNGMSTGEKIR